jgi:hypothetical protein
MALSCSFTAACLFVLNNAIHASLAQSTIKQWASAYTHNFYVTRLFFIKIRSSTCLPRNVIFIRGSFRQLTTKPSLWLQHDLRHDRLRRKMLPTGSKNHTTRTFIVETVVQEAFKMSQTHAIGTEHYKPYSTYPSL